MFLERIFKFYNLGWLNWDIVFQDPKDGVKTWTPGNMNVQKDVLK